MPRFCLDSNVFIQAKNGPYGMDIWPSFWTWLDRMLQEDTVVSSLLVYDEIARGKDELAEWVRDPTRKDAFLPPSLEVQEIFNDIVEYVTTQQYPEYRFSEFLDGADPWIIAQAKVDNLIVVTHETLVPENSKKIKVPNICRQFDVEWMNVTQMLRGLNARF